MIGLNAEPDGYSFNSPSLPADNLQTNGIALQHMNLETWNIANSNSISST